MRNAAAYTQASAAFAGADTLGEVVAETFGFLAGIGGDSDGDSDGLGALIAILAIIIGIVSLIAAGFFTVWMIVKIYAGKSRHYREFYR